MTQRTRPTVSGDGVAVDFFSDLEGLSPSNADSATVKFDENLDPAGIYVYYDDDPHEDYEEGYFPKHDNWYRIPSSKTNLKPQEGAQYRKETMPHRLVYSEANGTLTLDAINWRQRITGKQSTVKEMPSADGQHTIQCVEFFAGRLFLISEEHVTSSRNNDFFNLWVDSQNAVADDDRISTNITQAKQGSLLRAAVCGQALFLLAENGQLEFGSGDQALTNINGRIRTLTDFPSVDVNPGSGPGIVTMLDRYGDVHQYMWGGTPDPSIIYTDMLTAHYPKAFDDLTAERLVQIGTTLFVVCAEGTALTHDTFVLQGKAVQSAWSTFTMPDAPLLFDQWRGKIRVICKEPDSNGGFSLLHYVHRLVPPPEGMLYEPCMDRLELIQPSEMTYDEDTDETTMSHTGRDGSVTASHVVTRTEGDTHVFIKAKRLDDNGDPIFDGDLTGGSEPTAQYLGFNFDAEMTLSKLYAELSGRGMQMQRLIVFHHETTDYTVSWQPFTGASSKADAFQAHKVGVAKIGQASFDTGYHEVGIVADPRDGTLHISSSSPGTFAILALEYELQPQGRG